MAETMRRELQPGGDCMRAAREAVPDCSAPEQLLALDMAREDAVFVFHIAKCAGTAIFEALNRAVGRRVVPYAPGVYPLPKVLPPRAIVVGAISWGVHRHWGQDPRYGVVLREPADRAVSLYRWMRRTLAKHPEIRSNPRRDALWRADELGLDAIVASGHPELNNPMTAALAGRRPVGPDDVETLELAIAHLRQVEWLDIQGDGLDCDALGRFIGAPIDVRRSNVAPVGLDLGSVTPAERVTVEERNRLDHELVAEARRLLARRQVWSRVTGGDDRPRLGPNPRLSGVE